MKSKHLVMFDIEGTLVTSNDIDTMCYCEAIQEVFKINQIDTDWTHYSYVTDSGITAEIGEKYSGRKADKSEIDALQIRYLDKLHKAIKNNPHYIEPIAGARELIDSLLSNNSFCVALATGCWRKVALLKLGASGIHYQGIPLASADDSFDRESIMARAYEMAKSKNNFADFNAVTYVGDGHWDYVAASAVVIRDGKVLMIKRSHEPNKGMWSIPGGRVELGETVYEAAQREVREECNIEVEILRLLFVGNNIIRDDEGKVKYHYVLIDLLAEYKGGDILAQSDAEEYRWVAPEELPGLDITPQLRTLLMQVMS